MTDIFLLTTSASWRKLNHLCGIFAQTQGTDKSKAQYRAICYISIAPYSSEDGSGHLAELAKNDAVTACTLALYRASLLIAYKHLINKDLKRAHEECYEAITYLHEGLNRLGITTELPQDALSTRAHCMVNSLASQAELQEARSKKKIASHLVFILGMHRSGTSALTGMLAKAGFSAPSDLMPATVANPKGYWESLSIIRLNEDFIIEMESHWSSSLSLPAGWIESIGARKWRTSLINIIAETYRGAELPTIKDPRFCKLIMGLEPWFESRLIDTSFMIPIRHPLEVINSLLQAEGIDLYKALRLWIKSIFMTEQATRGHRRKFISFDVLIQDPTNCLETCLQLVESAADPESAASIADYHNRIKPQSNYQATEFIDKCLKRQQPVITEKCLYRISKGCDTRLIQLAVSAFHAIISNIADDRSISKALDELRPDVHASV
jgi:hypothetical protein